MTQPFKRRKPKPDPVIIVEETEYYDEPFYPNRELPHPMPTGSRRKRSLTDFPRNYEVAKEVTDWSSAIDFIDKYADRAKEWWNQLMDRLKHDDYNTPASLIDRALGAVPLPASRQPRRTNMRGRRILSQDVSEVVGDPQFDEVREQVSEGLADELGQVVMRTLDDVAAPIEEALGRPLEESEVLDVHEVVTDIVHETLDQVSEEMTEGIAEPVEEEELPEEETEEEEPTEGSSVKRSRDTALLTEADIREFLSIAKDILWTRMTDRGMIQGGGTRTQMDPHYYEGKGELAVSIKGTDSDFDVFFDVGIDRLGNAGWHGTGPLGSDGGKAGKLSGDCVRNADKYEDVADEAVRMVIDFLQLQFDEYGKENLPERQGRRAMKRNAGKYSGIAEEAWQWVVGQLEGDAPFKSTDDVWDAFWKYAREFAEDPENELTEDEREFISENLASEIEGCEDIELWYVEEAEGEESLEEEVRVPVERIEDWIAGGPTYHGELGENPGDEVWISHDGVAFSSAGYEEGDYTITFSGTMSEDMKHVILTKWSWEDVPATYDEGLWQEAEGLLMSLGKK